MHMMFENILKFSQQMWSMPSSEEGKSIATFSFQKGISKMGQVLSFDKDLISSVPCTRLKLTVDLVYEPMIERETHTSLYQECKVH